MTKITDIIGKVLLDRSDDVEKWFAKQYSNAMPFFYSSVDLRHSGDKLVPVDTNLFPAGFNLLSDRAREIAITHSREFFSTYFPEAKKILLIAEDHTRNLYYLENIYFISQILKNAGFDVKISNLAIAQTLDLQSSSGQDLTFEPIIRDGSKISVEGFIPDIILVNNDLSGGAPEILCNIAQPVIPPVGMGWYRRRKTSHFDSYDNIARRFATEFGFDPWLISSSFTKCGTIDFKEKRGLECVARNVGKLLHKIENKYTQYGITTEPYVFIKADSGTYGMGIMTVKSSEEVFEMNKKIRKKMNVIKEGIVSNEVIIQEGIPTIDVVGGKVAEPMIYMIGGDYIGCTMRINESRDNMSNLNSSGMTFDSVCHDDKEAESGANTCPVQSLIARLASLAATAECYEENWDI